MGSEFTDPDGNAKPMHKVTITKLFYLGKFEVTQEQWEAVMGSNPSKFKGAKNPVTSVSWEDCQTFLQKLQEKVPGQTLRLPTEAEWEYACRAGSASEYCYGDGDGRLGEYAWYDSNSDKMAHSVGEKKPNAWGLYDMHGNVAEWCVDWFEKYDSSVATDPVGPATGSKRVMRGASWFNPATDCQSAIRRAYDPSRRNIASGLRVVMEAR
jgi:formylglycine-generating enzyme required for sulfatase activity